MLPCWMQVEASSSPEFFIIHDSIPIRVWTVTVTRHIIWLGTFIIVTHDNFIKA